MASENFKVEGDDTEDWVDFGATPYTCYGVKLTANELVLTENNKIIKKIPKAKLGDLDLNDVGTVSRLIDLVRKGGVSNLLSTLNIVE